MTPRLEIHWFGITWGAACCTPDRHIERPVGETCHLCSKPIGEFDQGVALHSVYATIDPNPNWPPEYDVMHVSCFLRYVLPEKAMPAMKKDLP